jgi:hypothetical protein
MRRVPKPRLLGGFTFGPPLSAQLISTKSPARCQVTLSLPSGTLSAPYFRALVLFGALVMVVISGRDWWRSSCCRAGALDSVFSEYRVRAEAAVSFFFV